MVRKFEDDPRVRLFIGDVRDKERFTKCLMMLITLSIQRLLNLFLQHNIIHLSVFKQT